MKFRGRFVWDNRLIIIIKLCRCSHSAETGARQESTRISRPVKSSDQANSHLTVVLPYVVLFSTRSLQAYQFWYYQQLTAYSSLKAHDLPGEYPVTTQHSMTIWWLPSDFPVTSQWLRPTYRSISWGDLSEAIKFKKWKLANSSPFRFGRVASLQDRRGKASHWEVKKEFGRFLSAEFREKTARKFL